MELREKVARTIFDDDEDWPHFTHEREEWLAIADRVLAIPEIAAALRQYESVVASQQAWLSRP